MTSAHDPLALAAQLRKKGVIEYFGTHKVPSTEHLHIGFGQLVDLSLVTRAHAVSAQGPMFAWGINRDPVSAAWSTLGEILERYCGAVAEKEQLTVGTFAEIGPLALDPQRLNLLEIASSGSHGDVEHSVNNNKLSWIAGHIVNTNRPVLIPAATIFAPFECLTRGDFTFPPNATGFGCGKTYYDAITHGIYEVIERDALALAWDRGRSTRVGSTTFNSVLPNALNIHLDRHDTVSTIELTTDTQVPTFMVVIETPEDARPAISLGFCTDLDSKSAITHAFREAMLSRHLLSQLKCHRPKLFTRRYTGIPKDPLGRAIFLSQRRNKGVIDNLRNGETFDDVERVTLAASARDRCFDAVTCVASLGYDVIVVDLTRTLVQDMGMRVVKILIPGFQPLEAGNYRYQRGPRCSNSGTSSHRPRQHPFPI